MFGMNNTARDTEKIFLAAYKNLDLSDVGVNESPENIDLYWRLASEIAQIIKSGKSLHIPI
jgi:hypothetical protein